MYLVSSPTAVALALALLLASLCGQVAGFPGLFGRQAAVTCLDTPFLKGFTEEPAVATPYCYSFLGEPTVTKTLTKTVTNSTATIISSSVRTTITQIVTAPSSTLTSTSEVIIDNRKRAPAPAPAPTPAVEMPAVPAVVLAASAGGDPYLSASVSSACSCLFIPLSTTRIRTTVYATQIVSEVLVEASTTVTTVTQGISTTVTTITLYRAPLLTSSTLASSISATSTTIPTTSSTSSASSSSSISPVIPSFSISFPTFTSTVISSTGAPFPTSNSTTIRSTGAPFPTSSSATVQSTGAPFPTSNSTTFQSTGAPFPTSNSTAIRSTGAPFPTFNSTTVRSTGAPFPTFNSTTVPSKGAPFPTFNSTTVQSTGAPFPTFNSTTVPSTGAPFPTFNSTTVRSTGGPFHTSNSTTVQSTGAPFPTFNSTTVRSTGAPFPTFNSTSLTGTGSFPTASTTSFNLTSTPTNATVFPSAVPTEASDCPIADQTVYTAPDGEKFQLSCDIVYSGDQTFGVNENDIYACIEDCAETNQGFSGLRCHGVTWYPTSDTEPNCFYKSTAQVAYYTNYTGTISALLLSLVLPGFDTANTTVTNNTSILPSLTSNRTSIATITAAPTTVSVTSNSTGPPIIALPSSSMPRGLLYTTSSTATPPPFSISLANDIGYIPSPTSTTMPVQYTVVVVTSSFTSYSVITSVFTTQIPITVS